MNKFFAGLAIAAALCFGGVPAKAAQVFIGGYDKTNITTGKTTSLLLNMCYLHAVNIGTHVASATIKLYDGATAVNIFATLTEPSTITSEGPISIIYDAFLPSCNLTVVTSGATDVTVLTK